jgi:hypothetical protein
MLCNTEGQVRAETSTLEPSASVLQGYAQGCVEYLWLGLGKQLQQASGVAEAELEGDGLQPAAAAAAAVSDGSGGSSSGSFRTRGGDEVLTPELQKVWSMYSNCLFEAKSLYQSEWQRKELREEWCRTAMQAVLHVIAAKLCLRLSCLIR